MYKYAYFGQLLGVQIKVVKAKASSPYTFVPNYIGGSNFKFCEKSPQVYLIIIREEPKIPLI